jgi:hypothetical protein
VVRSTLKKLGRAAVWLAAGSQFVDLVWRDEDVVVAHDGCTPPARTRMTQDELLELILRAETARSHASAPVR